MEEIKSRLEKLSDSGRRLKISVPSSIVERKERQLLEKYSKEVAVDGFRKGKVPKSIIEKKYGAALKGEALEDICRDAYLSVIKKKGIFPLTRAEIDNIKQDSKQLSFTASFEVLSDVEINYDDIVIDLPFSRIREEDVDKVIGNMRFSYATYTPVVRLSAPGDYMVMDYEYMKEIKGILRPEKVTNFGFILGSDKVLDEFNKNLVGKRPGENVKINIRYPIDYGEASIAGREVSYKVRINEVKEVRLPAVDNDFAKICGFKDLEELRENVKESLSEKLKSQISELLPSLILNKLIDRHEFQPPAVFVNIAIDTLKGDIENRKTEPMDEGKIRERAVWEAKVRTILTIIAYKENLVVEDGELEDLLKDSLEPSEIKAVLRDPEKREYLKAYFRRSKASDLLVEKAEVRYAEKPDDRRGSDRKNSPKEVSEAKIITNELITNR